MLPDCCVLFHDLECGSAAWILVVVAPSQHLGTSFAGGGGGSSLSSSLSCSGLVTAMCNVTDCTFVAPGQGPLHILPGFMPPLCFDLLRIFDSCFSLTSNFLHTSFAVHSLRNLHLNLNHIAAASNHVGPYLGALFNCWQICMRKYEFLKLLLSCSSSM